MGVRRCGKSTKLEMVAAELEKRGIAEENIIERRYNEIMYEDFSAKEMYADIKLVISDKGRCYLLLDELSLVHKSGVYKLYTDIHL